MHPGSLRCGLAWLFQALRPKPNCLRRGVDRVTAALVAVLLAVAVVGVPASGVLANEVYEQQVRAAAVAATERHLVEAVQVSEPRIAFTEADSHVPRSERWAEVRWTGGDGRPRTASTEVGEGSGTGSAVMLWVDEDERITTVPPTEQDAVVFAAFSAVLFMLAVQSLCLVMIMGLRGAADAYALRAWQREWELVQPEWSRRGY